MNWIIVSQMRSGSTFLGEWLQNAGLQYFNELFTPEICRRSKIWPRECDEAVNNEVLSQIWKNEGAGFKLIYGQSSMDLWSRLQLAGFVAVVHIVRDDLLEQYCSIRYLEEVGVSMATEEGCYGTDGNPCQASQRYKFKLTPKMFIDWADETVWWREYVRRAFSHHQYFELNFRDCFDIQSPVLQDVFVNLGVGPVAPGHKPNHIKTPRPTAREMISNWEEFSSKLMATDYRGEIEKCA